MTAVPSLTHIHMSPTTTYIAARPRAIAYGKIRLSSLANTNTERAFIVMTDNFRLLFGVVKCDIVTLRRTSFQVSLVMVKLTAKRSARENFAIDDSSIKLGGMFALLAVQFEGPRKQTRNTKRLCEEPVYLQGGL